MVCVPVNNTSAGYSDRRGKTTEHGRSQHANRCAIVLMEYILCLMLFFFVSFSFYLQERVSIMLIRKTPYSRTNLFITNDDVKIREFKCLGGLGRMDSTRIYHRLPEVYNKPNVSCWHCCEPFSDGMPIPRAYDSHERTFHVFGAVCSPACAKAYIIEHTSFDRGQRLNVLARMLSQAYGITDHVVATPPRAALQRFGGPIRATGQTRNMTLVSPPFISYCMIAEEHREDRIQEDVTMEESSAIEEPHPPGMYGDFVAKCQEKEVEKMEADVRVSSKRASVPRDGPLSRYVRARKTASPKR